MPTTGLTSAPSDQLSLGLDTPNEDAWRLVPAGDLEGIPVRALDVPESIPAMAYGTHQFFRYYGKFPSIVGREMVTRFSPEGGCVLDYYCGSGTTLVEAQIAGRRSFGLDVNPLAVLAANVKTAYPDLSALRTGFEAVLASIPEESKWRPSKPPKWLDKWFSPEVQADLARLREAVLRVEDPALRDFLTVAYLAIVRRVSWAFDGEIRPHFNPNKRPRNVIPAFAKKTAEMLDGFVDLNNRRPQSIPARAMFGDNRDASSYAALLNDASPDLVVAHPPYLNSFNYFPVYNLEFAWSEELPAVWTEAPSLAAATALEEKSWPATNDQIKSGYYESIFASAKTAAGHMHPGSILAIVIGDATIRGVLEPVHLNVWDGLQERGFEPVEIWYRTTHYGIGKYAYSSRADYHGDAAEKRDGILFLRAA
ncbi:DNA methyltransferase [Modestobacter sp. SYSU DS0511]